jgi:PTS system lactose-specific IIA component
MSAKNKKQISLKGFELVALAGEARSILLEALELAKSKKVDEAKSKVLEAEELIN